METAQEEVTQDVHKSFLRIYVELQSKETSWLFLEHSMIKIK